MTSPAREMAGRFFYPGPVEVHPAVLAAMDRPMLSHRTPEMRAIFARMRPRLQQLFRTSRPVWLGTCSATGFMDLAARSGVRETLLAIDGGFFGDRFAKVAAACGKRVVRLPVPSGSPPDPDAIAAALDAHRPDAVSLVHSETGNGVLADLEAIARVVRDRSDALLLVDGVTSVGGSPVETERWGLDFVFTGSQKALGLPPGLALGAASERFLERARGLAARGWYLDPLHFEDAARHDLPTQTPALPLVFALDFQLGRIEAHGGVAARWAHHCTLADAVERWVDANDGWRVHAAVGARSRTVTALEPPHGLVASALVRRMADRGYAVTGGLGAQEERFLRIGHMGDQRLEALEAMLAVLAEVASSPSPSAQR